MGAVYGAIVSVFAHGILIPALGFRYPSYTEGKTGWLWNLNASENISEIIGHIYWSVSIEVSMIAVLAYFGRPLQGDWVKWP